MSVESHAACLQSYSIGMKFRQFGFSLIELLFTVALLGILAALAIPSFQTMLVKRSVLAASDALVADMRFARSEALKRSTRTVICRSTNGTSCAAGTGSWNTGWIVFVDMNSNGAVDAGDDIVKVQQDLPNILSIQAQTGVPSTLSAFNYEPTGWAKAASTNFIVTPVGTVPLNGTRRICVSITGRPALRVEGATSC
jgi:type IV fimbrial biogenesis protein FimT